MLPILLVCVLQPKDAEPFAKWEKEVAGIEKRLAEAKPAPGGVLFYGSSSIRLWDLSKSFPGKAYLNAGFGGSQIRDCTHFVPRLVTPFAPRTIVFYAGDNDIANGRTAEQVEADFQAFRDAVRKDLPKCRILWLPVKPSLARWDKYDVQKKANALVTKLAESDPLLGIIDTVPGMLGADGKPIPELFVKDGLHMSPAGYDKWTALVKAAVDRK
jgi:lysophospholipase L1-like esterase